MGKDTIERTFELFFNERLKTRAEVLTIYVASIGFLIHLLLVFVFNIGGFPTHPEYEAFLGNPIAAIYTPFSFILVYEVYLLVYYLPRSFSISIAKQFEIVSLILIRRIFKDISNLNTEELDLFSIDNIYLFYDIVGFLLMFFLIFVFRYLLINKRVHTKTDNIDGFIVYKKALCVILGPVFIGLSIFSFGNWIYDLYLFNEGMIIELKDFNNIFYNEFFTALILVDVLILVASFRYTDRYSLIIRNTGFVVTTVLIRVAFSTYGLANITLLISGTVFGVIILYIYSLYDKIDKGETTKESYAYL
ncbi:MAG: hypothetical protein RLN90_04375 [Balneolaceae bacterium]